MHEVGRPLFTGFSLIKLIRARSFLEQFELLPINVAIPAAEPPFLQKLSVVTEERLEKCFDDLSRAQAQVDQFLESTDDSDDDDDNDDVLDFSEEISNFKDKLIEAISFMGSSSGKDIIDDCLKFYEKALDGRNVPGKFYRKWKKIFKTKVGVVASISLFFVFVVVLTIQVFHFRLTTFKEGSPQQKQFHKLSFRLTFPFWSLNSFD